MLSHKTLFGLLVISAVTALAPQCVWAQNRSSLAVTARIDSSATLSLTNNSGPVSTLTFSGYGNEPVPAAEGTITVSARVSTTYGNASTIIQIKGTPLTGQSAGDVIPPSCLSYTHATQSGAGTWSAGALSDNWQTLAQLTAGSGIYTGDQTYMLSIPSSTNDDTYTGTIYYQVIGF